MRVLITGATGKLGHAIGSRLLKRGETVRALVRDRKRAATILPAGIEPVEGDITEPDRLAEAVGGCELVFNSMGIPEQWVRDESIFDRVNAQGSGDLARAAKEAGVRRFVHTSTHDVFHADQGQGFDETNLADYPKGTAYERSKQRAEELVLAERHAMEVVILNPAGIYGPTVSDTASFENEMFEPLVKGRLPALPPGGTGVAYVDGVADGHLLASDKGRDGERYILADGYADFRDLAEMVVRLAGRGKVPRSMPVPIARALANVGAGISRVTRRPPLLPKGQLTYFLWQAHPDSSKAQSELGWEPTPLEVGLRRTLTAMGLLNDGAGG
jgi:nucleoside-diphosphate-sugar epimerase